MREGLYCLIYKGKTCFSPVFRAMFYVLAGGIAIYGGGVSIGYDDWICRFVAVQRRGMM
jgi:hypothetical protein